MNRLGLNRNVAVLMAVILVVGTGEELWVRFLPAYLVALGGGVWVVAAYGALFSFLDAVYQYPAGGRPAGPAATAVTPGKEPVHWVVEQSGAVQAFEGTSPFAMLPWFVGAIAEDPDKVKKIEGNTPEQVVWPRPTRPGWLCRCPRATPGWWCLGWRWRSRSRSRGPPGRPVGEGPPHLLVPGPRVADPADGDRPAEPGRPVPPGDLRLHEADGGTAGRVGGPGRRDRESG